MRFPNYLTALLGGSILFSAHLSVTHAATVFANPVNLGSAINSSATESGAMLSADGLSLYFHSDRVGGTGTGNFDLYMSNRSSINAPWQPAVNLGAALNSTGDDRAPSVSSDGLTLFFSSDRNGNDNLFVSTRASTNDTWGAPTGLGSTVNSPFIDAGPSLSADGLTLFFQTDRNNGNLNLFMTSRASLTDPWGTPVGLGGVVNEPELDLAPSISGDGLTLYFHSTRPGGPGTHNTWATERTSTTDPWGIPYLVSGLNSAGNAFGPGISADGTTLFYATDSAGGIDDSRDIWMVTAVPVPAALWLFASGLLTLTGCARRKRH